MTTERRVTTIYRDLTQSELMAFRRDTSETLWLVVLDEYVSGAHRILGWAGYMPVIWESGLSTYDARNHSMDVRLVESHEEAREYLDLHRQSLWESRRNGG